jgi:hypothetical protein
MGRRQKVSTMMLTKPVAGRKMMYTSGWPKNQKRCCQSKASPCLPGTKKAVPTSRSEISMLEASAMAGIEKMIITAVTSIAQA